MSSPDPTPASRARSDVATRTIGATRERATRAGRRTGDRRCVRVFEADPDLLAGADGETAARLRRRVCVESLRLAEGPWTATPGSAADERATGLLVLSGALARTTELQGHRCRELLGPGDLLRPWDLAGAEHDWLDGALSWRVVAGPADLAVLDGTFSALAGRCPGVVSQLLSRVMSRARRLSVQLSISQVRNADERMHLLLWHLAGCWGHVTPEGVVMPLALTHEVLGSLVCLRRPTACTALRRLERDGRIQRRRVGGWTLSRRPAVIQG